MAIPVLGDLESSKKYEAGDRILVLTPHVVSPEQSKIFAKNVISFCKAEVNVLVLPRDQIDLFLIRNGMVSSLIRRKEQETADEQELTRIDCGKVVFVRGDTIMVSSRNPLHFMAKKMICDWVGDFEIRFSTTFFVDS